MEINKLIRILLIILAVLILILIYLIFSIAKIKAKEREINLLESISKEVANSYEYELHKFDCTDFSKELVRRLKKQGFNAYCVYGTYTPSNYTPHTWVEVDVGNIIQIESTQGYIIPQEDFEEHYTILIKGECL